MTYELDASLCVPATPEEVYALLSDITRTGEWSVQTEKAEWNSEARGVGATFTGHNRTPERTWQTVSTVVIDEPGREFAWSVGPAEVIWGYRMQPQDGGTELIQYTRFGERAEKVFAERHGEDAARQIEIRRKAARAGMPATLERIAAILRGQSPATER
ncbi:SRPBCC family protein [Brachybacterium sp. GCM10030252]|uniref:SRPBCC family protein n=1 Tax=Brachybacterium sp. GCM10030252 TaxID=3273380 RepID=UPI0036130E93